MQSTSTRVSTNLSENLHCNTEENRKSHIELIPDISSPSSFTQSAFQPVNEIINEDVDKEKLTQLKCILLGDTNCGKSSLVISYTSNGFPDQHKPTAFDVYKVDINVEDRRVQLQICDAGGGEEVASLRNLAYPDCQTFILCFSVIRPASFYSLLEKWTHEIEPYITGDYFNNNSNHHANPHSNSSPQLPTTSSASSSVSPRQYRRHGNNKKHGKHHNSQYHYQYNKPCVLLVGCRCDERNNVSHIIDLSAQGEGPITEQVVRKYAGQLQADAYIECSSLTQKNLKRVFDLAVWYSLRVYDRGIELANQASSSSYPARSRKSANKHSSNNKRNSSNLPTTNSNIVNNSNNIDRNSKQNRKSGQINVNNNDEINQCSNVQMNGNNNNNNISNNDNNNNINNNNNNNSGKINNSTSSVDAKVSLWRKIFCLS